MARSAKHSLTWWVATHHSGIRIGRATSASRARNRCASLVCPSTSFAQVIVSFRIEFLFDSREIDPISCMKTRMHSNTHVQEVVDWMMINAVEFVYMMVVVSKTIHVIMFTPAPKCNARTLVCSSFFSSRSVHAAIPSRRRRYRYHHFSVSEYLISQNTHPNVHH